MKAVEAILAELEPVDHAPEEPEQQHESQRVQPNEEEGRMRWLTGAAIGVTAVVAIAGTVIAFIELDSIDPDE